MPAAAPSARNHSATHLLHEALRRALGEHVAQRGSLNAPDRLRFDFSHGAALGLDQIAQVEAEVNAFIRQNGAVDTRIMTPDDARALGAQALFGEKYGDEVARGVHGHARRVRQGHRGQHLFAGAVRWHACRAHWRYWRIRGAGRQRQFRWRAPGRGAERSGRARLPVARKIPVWPMWLWR